MVLGVCRRVLGDTPDVEDAFQATFLVLVRKARSIVPRHRVGNWLYGVAHRTATNAKTMTARRRAKERATLKPETQADDPASDLWPVLDQELSLLPEKYRAPVVLCDLEGRTQKKAAHQLGCPEGTVSTRLRAARSMLAKALTRRGVSLSGAAPAAPLARGVVSAGVPPGVMSSTMRFATLIAAGRAEVSAGVFVLTEGVLKTMLISKLENRCWSWCWLLRPSARPACCWPTARRVRAGERAVARAPRRASELRPATPRYRKRSRIPVGSGFTTRDPGAHRLHPRRAEGEGIEARGRGPLSRPHPGRAENCLSRDRPGTGHQADPARRDVNDTTEGTDTGFPVSVGDCLHWSADGKRVVRVRYASGYSHTLYDLVESHSVSCVVGGWPE